MAAKKITLWDYTWKSIKWCAGNALFALFPVLVLRFVVLVSTNPVFKNKLNDLIEDGVILFVCCAIVGATFVEFLISRFKYTANEIILIFVTPLVMHGLLAVEYILMISHVIDKQPFFMTSWTSKIVISFSTIYCILGKANYYIREDERHEQQRVQHNN